MFDPGIIRALATAFTAFIYPPAEVVDVHIAFKYADSPKTFVRPHGIETVAPDHLSPLAFPKIKSYRDLCSTSEIFVHHLFPFRADILLQLASSISGP